MVKSTRSMSGIGMTSLRTRQRLIARLQEQGVTNEAVLDVILNTPRHIFIDEALAHRAYEDTALPIGLGQTISQPYIVARMTELLLEVNPQTVLEVGTGSGYQTAILAPLIPHIFSIERIRPLLEKAHKRAQQLGFDNVRFFHSDGALGLPDIDGFDAIISAAAPEEVPQELLAQLNVGGRLIMPVGDDKEQHLVMVDRTAEGFDYTTVEPVKFVPLLSGTC